MKDYRFTIVLKNLDVVSDELAERIFSAGCDDCTPCSGEGRAYLGFDRAGETFQAAVSSAVSDIRALGLQVDNVVIEEADLATALD